MAVSASFFVKNLTKAKPLARGVAGLLGSDEVNFDGAVGRLIEWIGP